MWKNMNSNSELKSDLEQSSYRCEEILEILYAIYIAFTFLGTYKNDI